MPRYRIYWLDQNDRVSAADFLIADNDQMVRRGARRHLGDATAIEVWEGSRRVVRMTAIQDTFLAWIELTGDGFVASFDVGADRPPAMRVWPTEKAAREWVQAEVQALGAIVEWVPSATEVLEPVTPQAWHVSSHQAWHVSSHQRERPTVSWLRWIGHWGSDRLPQGSSC